MTQELASPSTAGASPAAIQQHYDVGDDFYRLWLDRSLTYSCAFWDGPSDDLESAQQRKLDLLLDLADFRPGHRLLDVGCGWGSMLRRVVDRDAGEAVGLTLSPKQAAHVRAFDDPRIRVATESWEDHTPTTPYDSMVCIGALEHFCSLGMPRAEKVKRYRQFFQKCHRLLAPGGRLSLQTIAKGNVPLDRQMVDDVLFILGKIFPESDLPRPSEILHGAEKLFEVISMRNDRDHYARTCEVWLERLLANEKAARSLVDAQVFESYVRYLRSSASQFRNGQIVLLRISLARVG